MDRVTMKVISHSCKMADITDQGVSCKKIKFNTSITIYVVNS